LPPPLPPDGLDSSALSAGLDALAQRVGRFLSRVKGDFDEIEVWVRRRDRRAWRITGHELVDATEPTEELVSLRVFRRGQMAELVCGQVDEGQWQALVKQGLSDLAGTGNLPPSAPRPRCPGPMTFDPELADALAPAGVLRRVAAALCDNTWHEAERVEGLSSLEGEVVFDVRRYVVGNTGGVVASLHGSLSARVELNGVYGDVFTQSHAPESFLPLALLGARTWRTMPRTLVTPEAFGAAGPTSVVLHPRLFEQLLRKLLGPLFCGSAQDSGALPFEEGDLVCANSVTLVDDPGLDGLATSRAFDDEGVPTRRTPLLVCGRLTQLLRSRAYAKQVGTVPSGSAWRADAPLRGAHGPGPTVTFGSLLMERGDTGFHEMVAGVDRAVLVHEVELEAVDPASTSFSALVTWGLTLETETPSRLLAPDAWRIRGRLLSLPGELPGLLDEVALSRELYDTGSAILPYCLCTLEV